MAQENRGNGTAQSGGSDSDTGAERRDVKGLTDDPTGHADIGGPEVPGTGTGGGTGTTGSAGDAGGMGADLIEDERDRRDRGDRRDGEDNRSNRDVGT